MDRLSTNVRPRSVLLLRSSLALIGALGLLVGCGDGETPQGSTRAVGQSEFESVPPNGSSSKGGAISLNGAAEATSDSSATASSTTAERKVEETDLYRLEGNRLYYLDSYRGLMVFDVTNVDAPQLLGRSPIFGEPIEMVVRDGIASVVVADWYGKTEDGTPFHGSIVRGLDATNPTQIRVVGEALLDGWVRDTRIVGDVLYAVTERYSWESEWYADTGNVGGVAVASRSSGATVAVTSVSFAGGAVQRVDSYDVPGEGGIFNVTPSSILLASNELGAADSNGYRPSTGRTELRYLDISDPLGAIRERGTSFVSGSIQGWGADNGRWNLDFADGKTAHALACSGQYCGNGGGVVLSTVDFADPDAPALRSSLAIPATAWSPTARFDTGRMYLSPSVSDCYYYANGTGSVTTPVQVFDLSDPAAPRMAGSTNVTGAVWLFMPAGDRLFALGNDCTSSNTGYYGSQVSLRYLDVANPSAPRVLGTAAFGEGWAWTPAAGTFKAFTKNDSQGLVVLPFSGWDSQTYQYNNGLQLIEFDPNSIATSGTAKTRGWVERGIFVNGRLVSLSDLSLAVIDYTNHAQPRVVSELTLARNVVNAQPRGPSIAELSSDWWDNDQRTSTLRVLPIEQAEENVSGLASAELEIEGYNASVFHDGDLSYVVSNVQREVACTADSGGAPLPAPDGASRCSTWTQQVQVVDRSTGGAVPRGKLSLPDIGSAYYSNGWGWYGCDYGWYGGADVVQVGGNALVFRRWLPEYSSDGSFETAKTALYVVDLSNPDQPSLGSTSIVDDPNAWWGNLRAVGSQLYATHYDWVRLPSYDGTRSDPGVVKYYLDRIDLTDRAHPRVGARINVPGILVGGSETNPSLVYTIDYRWMNDRPENDLAILSLAGDRAYLQSWLSIPGWVGNTFVRGNTAYFTAEIYDSATSSAKRTLYQVDLSNPSKPLVLPSNPTKGWGWLLGVEGDRALVQSGWGSIGLDVFRLSPGAAPAFERTVRTRGWWTSSLARQNNQLFVASGYWGTQVIDLE